MQFQNRINSAPSQASSSIHKPDRPIPSALWPIRGFVRRMRLVRLRLMLGTKLKCQRDLTVGANAIFLSPNRLECAHDVHFGRNVHIEADLYVGPSTLVSSNVMFVGNDHDFSDQNLPLTVTKRLPAASIVLEGNNLIGARSVIIGSVTVGEGAIIGAGSVVTHDIEPYTICAGTPAKVIGHRPH